MIYVYIEIRMVLNRPESFLVEDNVVLVQLLLGFHLK
jgi:hypothetical protein